MDTGKICIFYANAKNWHVCNVSGPLGPQESPGGFYLRPIAHLPVGVGLGLGLLGRSGSQHMTEITISLFHSAPFGITCYDGPLVFAQ
jgi:hypothetical protein